MCGIVAYLGNREAAPILLEGLKRLEYRGYDSAGLALHSGEGLLVSKTEGRVAELERKWLKRKGRFHSTCGIAHTRWATHGAPSDINAHPHLNQANNIALVHNGIIENYRPIRDFLEHEGVRFSSETDTEALVQLIGLLYKGDLRQAVQETLQTVEGTYGIAVIALSEPHQIVVARNGSPLLIGIKDQEFFVASDGAAIIEHTDKVVYLNDGEIATISPAGVETIGRNKSVIKKPVDQLQINQRDVELGEHPHFMIKEILEQPEALEECLRGRLQLSQNQIVLGGIQDHLAEIGRTRRFIITGCGTAFHAGLVGKHLIENLVQIPTEVEYASEFRYRNPVIDSDTTVIALSQSGETADTLAAVKEAKSKGAQVLSLVNVVASSIARETGRGVYLHVGPEIGVASTKAYLGQVATLTMLALTLGRQRQIDQVKFWHYLSALASLPNQIREVLKQSEKIREVADHFKDCRHWLYLGRGYNYATALEGALKLKEVSYLHAEGMPAAEMKHGPLALVDENMPVVFIATRNSQYNKIIGNIEEVRARKGRIIAVGTEGDNRLPDLADQIFWVPDVPEPLQPLLTVIPLQLLAYHAAVLLGRDVDKPRNLAKAVTVE
jgi:glucosamine--fructose-6-phosphate aminotransferase (isomerizing)